MNRSKNSVALPGLIPLTADDDGPAHGGDDAAAAAWPDAPRPLLDLSTGINPFGYPLPDLSDAMPCDDAWRRLPQRDAEIRLKQALVRYLDIPADSADTLVLAPGSQILINQVPYLFRPRRVSVLSPTYGEHAPAWRQAGHDVVTVTSLHDFNDFDSILVITNPNNPDGRIVERETLARIAARMRGRNGVLVMDEAFADTLPDIGMAGTVRELPVVVLRSFGKFFGLAGVRLGVLAAAPVAAAHMARRLGPWCVSGPALEIAARAYADAAWIAATRRHLVRAAKNLDTLLKRHGMEVTGGTSLFRYARHDRAAALRERLGARGILVRGFADRPDRLRFGLPADDNSTQRLSHAFKEIMANVDT
ncbi:threonine-phosphate decarboxylase CobD [Eilatimonas milleporae]|uniref:threonine-phosphate decarboxylase CobD n=1 Tax=Eilatimonas milleporae TaxID=911205 RepID=UPI000EFA09A3|nr:threonine-phosphate decarboxylase CobD [Eilatimonas milleporae]